MCYRSADECPITDIVVVGTADLDRYVQYRTMTREIEVQVSSDTNETSQAEQPASGAQVLQRTFADFPGAANFYIWVASDGGLVVESIAPSNSTRLLQESTQVDGGNGTGITNQTSNTTAVPLNQTKIITQEYQLLMTNYTILNFTAGSFLLYTKTGSDSLPITKTAVEAKPCLISGQISDAEGSLYKLEQAYHDQTLHCSFNDQYFRSDDDRYAEVGWNISEYEMQQRSGVFESIHEMPLYSYYVPDPEETKKEKIYKLWKRSTLGWELECEGSVDDFWDPEP